MCGSTLQHCIPLSQWLTPISHGVLTSAGMCPPRPIGRPILVLVPVPLAKPAPERRGFVIEAVAERATPRVGRPAGERKRENHDGPLVPRARPRHRISHLPRPPLHHPASLPCNRLYSPGPPFRSVCSISTLTHDSCAVKGENMVNSPTLDRCPHQHKRLHLNTQKTST